MGEDMGEANLGSYTQSLGKCDWNHQYLVLIKSSYIRITDAALISDLSQLFGHQLIVTLMGLGHAS